MRAVKFVNGIEYRQLDLSEDFVRARDAYRSHAKGFLLPGNHGAVTSPIPSNIKAPASETPFPIPSAEPLFQNPVNFDINTSQALIIGVDNRYYVNQPQENLVSWYVNQWRSPHVYFGGCSGTMIGAYTAISAAHCFYQRATGTTPAGWIWSRISGVWGLGRIQNRNSSSGPFTTTYSYGPYGPYSTGTSCFTVLVPGNYTDNTNDTVAALDDFAIIEFGCSHQPGLGGNNYPPAYTDAAGYASSYLSSIRGYESNGSDSMLPGGVVPSTYAQYYSVPTLMGRDRVGTTSGAHTLHSNQIHLYGNEYFDGAGGLSGAGLIMTPFSNVGDHTPCWVGDVVGPSGFSNQTTGTTTARLMTRRVTGGSWGFIVDNSAEFN